MLPRTVRRVKPFYFANTAMSSMTTSNGGKRLLRIEFKDPNEDYVFTHDLSNHGTLVCNRKNPLQLAVVRESYSPAPLQMLLTLSQIQHPNIADVLDVYFNRGRLSIVSEYLDVSLLELQLKALPLEEWELATIISEVCSSPPSPIVIALKVSDY